MEKIIVVQGLKKYFENVKAIDDISFEIEKGEIFGFIGPDGAGKTTLLRILAGLISFDYGKIEICGFNLPADAEKIKENIGYMPQKFSLYPDLTVEENISFFAEIFQIHKNDLERRIEPLLKMTRLSPFKTRLAKNLSGGMKQKLALMCTLIHRPKVLILDEPTTGVDPVSRRELWEILQEIVAEGITILLTTPYMDEAEWCRRIAFLFNGKIYAIDSPKKLKNNFNMKVLDIYFKNEKEEIIKKLKKYNIFDFKIAGNKIHLIIENNKILDDIKNEMGKHYEIIDTMPTIEDIFIGNIKGI